VGVRPGDILLAVNGVKVITQDDFQRVLNPIYKPGNNLTLTVLRNSTNFNYTITLAENPSNNSEGFIGIADLPLKQVTANYLSTITHFSYRDLALYLVIPTLPNVATSIPFSDQLHSFYVSNTFLGNNYFVLANLLYWIWLIDFSLAIFNALPLYPLDGGYVFKLGLKKVLGKRIGEKKVNIIVYSVSILLVFLIGFMIVAPYIL
jgi:membrane-associated protease RseP (regulator of RpoE activity)